MNECWPPCCGGAGCPSCGDGSEYEERTGSVFARPGSALRASSRRNPRNIACPTCKQPDRLTPADQAQGYQCDECADRDEGGDTAGYRGLY